MEFPYRFLFLLILWIRRLASLGRSYHPIWWLLDPDGLGLPQQSPESKRPHSVLRYNAMQTSAHIPQSTLQIKCWPLPVFSASYHSPSQIILSKGYQHLVTSQWLFHYKTVTKHSFPWKKLLFFSDSCAMINLDNYIFLKGLILHVIYLCLWAEL